MRLRIRHEAASEEPPETLAGLRLVLCPPIASARFSRHRVIGFPLIVRTRTWRLSNEMSHRAALSYWRRPGKGPSFCRNGLTAEKT